MRLIDADAIPYITPLKQTIAYKIDIDKMPTADRPQGKWWRYEGVLHCSNCHTEFYTDIMEYCGDAVPKFCPECGADMRMKGADDE